MTSARWVALALVATTLVLRPWGGIAANEAAPARLIEVSSRPAGTAFVVVIEASAPAAYTTHQPDDRTVVVELRNVTADGARLRLAPGGPVDDVEIEGAETEGRAGGATTRVRLLLSRPLPYSVSSSRSTISIGFDFDKDAVGPAAAIVAAAPVPPEAPGPTSGAPATQLQAIETLLDASAVVVRLEANGILTPSRIHVAEDAPPRLVIDLPEVESAVPGATRVDAGPIRQIRVAPHSHSPLVTRSVFDLASPAPHRVEGLESPNSELRVIFPLDDPIAAVAPPAVEEQPAGAPRSLAALAASSPTGTLDSVPEGPAGQAEAAPAVSANTILLDPLAALRVPRPVSAAQDAAVTGLLAELASATNTEPGPAPATPNERELARSTPTESERAMAVAEATTPLPPNRDRDIEPTDVPVVEVVPVAAPPETDILAPRVDPLAALTTTTPESVVAELPAATPTLESPPAVAPRIPETLVAAVAEPTRPTAHRTQLTLPATPPAFVAAGAPASPGAIPRPGLTAPRRFSAEVPTTRFIRRAGASSRPRVQVTQQRLGAGRQYTGSPVTMDFQNADLRSVLRTFAEISGLNIVIDPQVQGSVDVALVDVPWDQAFDIILRANQLGYDVDGTVVRIAPLMTLADEERQRRELAEEQALAGALEVMTRTLSYARAADLADLVTQAVLSSRGQVQIDVRTNTLIITDLQNNLLDAEELLQTLDRPEPQVEIEARIVQARQSYARELGVQWGVSGRVAPDIGNTTPLTFPNRGNVTGRVGGSQGPFPVDGRALESETTGTAVDLGAPGRTSALGLTLGAVDGSLNLDIVLSAAEGEGQVEILSNPRITTQNNVQATIIQGDQIPIQTVANNTVTVQFKDAALRLAVTPQITAADTVIMQIEIDNDFANFGEAVNGIPPIVTQRAITTVQVANGDTTVIGGIYESDRQRRNDRVPGLSRIPLLGWLFRRDTDAENTDELLIFLTPYIVR